jgi:nickel-dependent lactate racemase
VGIGAGDVTLAIASGTHAAAPGDAARERIGAWARGARLLAFRPEEATAFAGRTPAGTEVHVHPALLEADTVLAVGATAFHYFAGFGGGPKLLFPGLGARASIAANHRRALGPWPPGGLAAGVEPGRLAGNPVAEDLAAVAELLPRATQWTLWEGGAAGAVWSGRDGFAAVTERYARGRRVGPARAFDTVIASAGGHPRDLDLVQAHKALFHAALHARDGAALVLLAECEEGVGSAPLEAWLAVGDRAEREARARAASDLNAQTAISLAAISARCRVTWVGRGAPAALESLGITRTDDPVAAIRAALDGPPGAAACLPVAAATVPEA